MDLPRIQLTWFPTELGWFGMSFRGTDVVRLTIGHAHESAARSSLQHGTTIHESVVAHDTLPVVARLQAYAAGEPDDFADVCVDLSHLSRFQRRVVAACREIPYGSRLTYGALARLAGSPRAARAVGNTMARNRVPLVIPCHRVIAAGGGLGGFSAPQGTRLKRQLLAREAAACQLAGAV